MVWVRRSDWERVTEREELVGRFREASRLPQYLHSYCQSCRIIVEAPGEGGMSYLITAMFTGAVVLAR